MMTLEQQREVLRIVQQYSDGYITSDEAMQAIVIILVGLLT